MWAAALIGIGVMAAVDEIIFHQILAWHHFYDRSTSDIALMTDGFLHAAEIIAIISGFFPWSGSFAYLNCQEIELQIRILPGKNS